MNSAPLRRTILKELGIFATMALLLISLIWYLSVLQDDFTSQAERTGKAAEQVRIERQALENKFTNVKNRMADYDESLKWMQAPGLYIDAQAVRDLLNRYQAALFLKKVSVELQPIAEIGAPDSKSRLQQTRTSGKITMDALSDQDVYALMKAMQDELPGFVRITSFSISKNKQLTKELLAIVRREGGADLISAEIRFDWYGLKSTDAESAWSKYVSPQAAEEPTQ